MFEPLDYAPAYLRVSEEIRSRILRRELLEGQPLPTETELARQFEVNRSTVREALRKLETSGLLGREGATKHKAVSVATSTGLGEDSIPSRVRRGEPVDVVVLADAAIEELIKEGRILAGSRVALARSAIGMAVRAGAPKPDISSVEALKRTLLQAKSIAYSAQVSGEYLSTELFPRLGIADAVKAKTLRIERERVGAVVARGEAEIGFQQISELLPIAGIDYVGPLPAEAQRVTVFSAGVAGSPEAARALIRFFTSAEGARAMVKYGLEPIPR